MKIIAIIFTLFLSTSAAMASMIPQNNLYIGVKEKSLSQISESEFHEIIDLLEGTYRPFIEGLGVQFTVERDWQDGVVNAKAWKKEGHYFFKMYGGLARFETMTADSFTLVGCHELGHLIGGAPTIKPFNIASSEGQADYFSTSRCFKKIVKGQDHKKVMGEQAVDPYALDQCGKSFKEKTESYEICLRTSLANRAMALTFASLSGLDQVPEFDTPDPYVRMFIIFNGYPNPQCRLDTLFAGSLCNLGKQAAIMPDLEKYNQGFCSKFNGHERGLRPLCWYVPRSDEDQSTKVID